jgi:hypothetical protein
VQLASRVARHDVHERRTEQMSRVPKANAHACREVEPAAVGSHLHEAQGAFDVVPGVERQSGVVLREALLVQVLGILFLQVRRVVQQNFRQVARRGRAVDGTLEPVAHQLRQETAMIDVCVGQHHPLQRRWLEGERRPIPEPQFLQSLEHAAIDEQAIVADLEQESRAGDRAGTAVETETNHARPLWSSLSRMRSRARTRQHVRLAAEGGRMDRSDACRRGSPIGPRMATVRSVVLQRATARTSNQVG